MPVRIYDIARKLGIASTDVLSHAKDMGIENAKVASSSLDKITAEYLESAIGKLIGAESGTEPEPEQPAKEAAPEPVVKIIKEEVPEPEPEIAAEP